MNCTRKGIASLPFIVCGLWFMVWGAAFTEQQPTTTTTTTKNYRLTIIDNPFFDVFKTIDNILYSLFNNKLFIES